MLTRAEFRGHNKSMTNDKQPYTFVAVYTEPTDSDPTGHWTHHRTREAAVKATDGRRRHGRVVEILPEHSMGLAAQDRVIEQIKASL